jgi:hypothetical protein
MKIARGDMLMSNNSVRCMSRGCWIYIRGDMQRSCIDIRCSSGDRRRTIKEHTQSNWTNTWRIVKITLTDANIMWMNN